MQLKNVKIHCERISVREYFTLGRPQVQSAALPKGQGNISHSTSAGKGLCHPFHEDHICKSFPVNRLITPYEREEQTNNSTVNSDSLVDACLLGICILAIFFFYNFIYVCGFCLHECLCTMSLAGVCGGQKRVP